MFDIIYVYIYERKLGEIMALDLEKERELEELHSELRRVELEITQHKEKLEQLELIKLNLKEKINEKNDDEYISEKLEMLYEQRKKEK